MSAVALTTGRFDTTLAQSAPGSSITTINAVASAGVFQLPWDATPDPQGKTIYFTATSASGAGIFSVPANDGDVKPVAVGVPFVLPMGIAISPDGKQLYAADPYAAGTEGNVILTVPAAGGVPVVVAGSQGTLPHGLEVVSENGVDQIYYSGINPSDSQPAILKLPAAGGTPTVIVKGAPLVDPSGVTLAKDGTVYVVDRLAAGNGLGAVFRIKAGAAPEKLADKIRPGAQYVGLTLTLDETTLMVSSLNTQTGTAQVLIIDLATGQASTFDKVIGVNSAAGGLHRAHDVSVFAWADTTAQKTGTVFVIK